MKKLLFLIVAIVTFGLIVSGCLPVVPPVEQGEISSLMKGDPPDFFVDDDNCPGPGTGTELDPFCTIQAAINAASDGDTISVADGTYTITAAINVNKEITITGNILNPGNVVVKYSPTSTSLNGFEIGAANITIQGFKIIDCFRGVHFGRNDVASTGCTITNCVFDNNSENAIGEVAAENTTISNNAITNCNMGIEIRANEATSLATRTEVTGNTISSCSQSCIQTYLGKYVYIYGNTISNTNDKGINVIRSNATGTSDRIQVISNTIYETKWPGIQVIGAPYTYVYDNTLTQCNYYGEDNSGDFDYASIHVQDDIGPTYSNHTIIDSNTVRDGINGIQIWSDNCTVTNNKIYDMGLTYADTKGTEGVGDGVYYNSGIIIGTNWLTDNFEPTGTIVRGNTLTGNVVGLFIHYASNNEAHFNNIEGNTNYGVYNDDTNVFDATYNWWGHPGGPRRPAGNSGKISGPKAADQVSENVFYHPWLSGTNSVSNIALDQAATASATYQSYTAARAVDGDYNTSWIADGYPPQWIEIDLGKGSSVVGLRFLPDQTRVGLTTHVVMFSNDDGVVGYYTFAGVTEAKQWVEAWFDAPFRGVRTVRVTTEVDTIPPLSWVAWFEIEVYGWQ